MEANYLVYMLFFASQKKLYCLSQRQQQTLHYKEEHAIAYRRHNHITYVNLVCSKGDRTCEQNMAALQCFTTITTTSCTHPRRFFPCCAAKQKQTTGFPISLSRWLFVAEICISYYIRLSVIHQIMIFWGKFKDAKFQKFYEEREV